MQDAYDVGSFSPCGGPTYLDNHNSSSFDGITYFNSYDWDYYGHQNTGQPATDVWYSFKVSGHTNIRLSLCGSDFDTYIHLVDSQGAEIAQNDDSDECGLQSQISYDGLPSGTYYIVVEGYDINAGDYSLSVSSTSAATPWLGASLTNPIPVVGIGSCGGTFTDTRSNESSCFGNDYGHQSNDIYYKLNLTTPSSISISNCGSNFDTYLYLLNSNGVLVASNDDNYSSPCPGLQAYLQLNLSPGIYYVVTEGYGLGTGNIKTTITSLSSGGNVLEGANATNAINWGNLDAGSLRIDNRSNVDACLGNDFGESSTDIYYKFNLTTTQVIKIRQKGAGFPTRLSLVSITGDLISSVDNSNGNLEATIDISLQAGEYFIVSEGVGNNTGEITTKIHIPVQAEDTSIEQALENSLEGTWSLLKDIKNNYKNGVLETSNTRNQLSGAVKITFQNGEYSLRQNNELIGSGIVHCFDRQIVFSIDDEKLNYFINSFNPVTGELVIEELDSQTDLDGNINKKIIESYFVKIVE